MSMPLPGFTAEAGLGPTVQVYRVHRREAAAAGSYLSPQFDGEDSDDLPEDQDAELEMEEAEDDSEDNGLAELDDGDDGDVEA
jgi:hypothetical protein